MTTFTLKPKNNELFVYNLPKNNFKMGHFERVILLTSVLSTVSFNIVLTCLSFPLLLLIIIIIQTERQAGETTNPSDQQPKKIVVILYAVN